MIKYCKAYKLQALREFSHWAEQVQTGDDTLCDDDIAFLWEDFTVTRSVFEANDFLLEHITPEWQDFCKTILQFVIPGDLQQANQQTEAVPSE